MMEDGPDGVASSRIVGAVVFIIFPTPHKIQNDERCSQHVSGLFWYWPTRVVLDIKGHKTAVCVCVRQL